MHFFYFKDVYLLLWDIFIWLPKVQCLRGRYFRNGLLRQELAMKAILIVSLTVAVLFSCSLFEPGDDLEKFGSDFMSTYQLNKIVEPATNAQVKAIVPAWDVAGPTTFTSGSISDYPEYGQVTSWTVTATAMANVYLIEATTDYTLDENIDRTEEFYHVMDMDPIDNWGAEDLYVDANGIVDSKTRLRFRTYFTDGTTRREKILFDATDGVNSQYAFFDIDGSLDYFTLEIPLEAFNPGENSQWSSVVEYSHNMKDNQYWNWWGTLSRASLQGERYYSQKMIAGVLTQSLIFKEIGRVRKFVWDEGVDPPPGWTEDDEKSALFTGVMRIQIVGDQKTIKAKYTIDAKSGTYTVEVDGDSIIVY